MNGKELAMGIASFILGVISIVVAWYGWYSVVAMATAITGVILSSLVIKCENNGIAVAGMILGIAGIVCAFIGTGKALICSAIVWYIFFYTTNHAGGFFFGKI